MLEMEMADKNGTRAFRHLGVAAATMVDDIATLVGRQLSGYTIRYQAAAAAKLGIPLTDVKALDLVMAFDALATGHLAQLLGVSAGGATALINRLELAGLVIRDRHPLDRRIIVIRPVPEKCDVLLRERHALTTEIAALTRRYDPSEMETVHAFANDIARIMRRDTLAWLDAHDAHPVHD